MSVSGGLGEEEGGAISAVEYSWGPRAKATLCPMEILERAAMAYDPSELLLERGEEREGKEENETLPPPPLQMDQSAAPAPQNPAALERDWPDHFREATNWKRQRSGEEEFQDDTAAAAER